MKKMHLFPQAEHNLSENECIFHKEKLMANISFALRSQPNNKKHKRLHLSWYVSKCRNPKTE